MNPPEIVKKSGGFSLTFGYMLKALVTPSVDKIECVGVLEFHIENRNIGIKKAVSFELSYITGLIKNLKTSGNCHLVSSGGLTISYKSGKLNFYYEGRSLNSFICHMSLNVGMWFHKWLEEVIEMRDIFDEKMEFYSICLEQNKKGK